MSVRLRRIVCVSGSACSILLDCTACTIRWRVSHLATRQNVAKASIKWAAFSIQEARGSLVAEETLNGAVLR